MHRLRNRMKNLLLNKKLAKKGLTHLFHVCHPKRTIWCLVVKPLGLMLCQKPQVLKPDYFLKWKALMWIKFFKKVVLLQLGKKNKWQDLMIKQKEVWERRIQTPYKNKYLLSYKNLAKIFKMKMNLKGKSNKTRIIKTLPKPRIIPILLQICEKVIKPIQVK